MAVLDAIRGERSLRRSISPVLVKMETRIDETVKRTVYLSGLHQGR